MAKKYDIAAYIWPAYTGKEPRTHLFWPERMGEWETVRKAGTKFPGHTWPRKPLWGYVDEADPYVMEMEIAAAVDHGVNVFIYDWYWYDRRPFLEQCLNEGFLRARNKDQMKFYLMWANHDANDTWDIRNAGNGTVIWDGKVERAEFERICRRLLSQYFTLPNYYRIQDKPVFMIYDLANLIDGLGGIERTREALNWFREQAVLAGLPGLHLQAVLWGERSLNLSGVDRERSFSQREVVEKLGFDSASHYQYVHFVDIAREYEAVLPEVTAHWKEIRDSYSVPYFPHVSLGWDNNPRYIKSLSNNLTGNTPELIQKAFLEAKAFVDARPELPPLITVNSWNEWTESSYLQPDDRNGYGYLDAIRGVFGDGKD